MSKEMIEKTRCRLRLIEYAAVCLAVSLFAGVVGAQTTQLQNFGFGVTSKGVPKFNYSQGGHTIMEKRYDANLVKDVLGMNKFPFKLNRKGLQPLERCSVFSRSVNNIFSEQQKQILNEWGQPDYLRGPYRSTRGDQVNEWAYLQANHIFQFVGGEMVYEGPLTDEDRTLITYGTPTEITVTQAEPGTRLEFWVYRKWYSSPFHERIFKFSNGKMIFHQEAP